MVVLWESALAMLLVLPHGITLWRLWWNMLLVLPHGITLWLLWWNMVWGANLCLHLLFVWQAGTSPIGPTTHFQFDNMFACTNIWQIKNFGCTFQFNKIVCVWQKCIFIWLHSKICYCLQLSQCFRNWLYLFCLVRWLYIWSLESPLWNYSVSHCDLTNFFCSFFRAKAAHQQFAWRHEGRSLDYLPTTQQQQV